MKKIFFVFLFLSLTATAFCQVKISPNGGYLLNNYNLSNVSGTDTAFSFEFTNMKLDGFSIQAEWYDIDTTGSLYLKASNFVNRAYVPYYDSLGITMTDTIGYDAMEDDRWNFKYGQISVEMDDTITTGRLTIFIYPAYH